MKNSSLIPQWLKEILENGKPPKDYSIFNKSTRLAMIPKLSTKLYTYSSIDDLSSTGRNKKNIAFFRDGPFLPQSTGAVTSILGEIEALVDRGFNVYLFYCFRGWCNPKLYQDQKFTTIFIKPQDFYTNKDVVSGLINTLGIYLCQLDSAEAVVVQSKLIHPEAKVVFEVHNIEYDLLSQLGANNTAVSYMKIKEIKAIKLSDLVLFRSQQNQELLETVTGDMTNARIYRGCINTNKIRFSKNKIRGKNILFLGHLNYAPNIQAVECISKIIAPNVNAEFFIAGAGSDKLRGIHHNPNINFLGRIDDLNNLLSKMDIGLAPLTSGSGTRLKILDYMAAGIPVIGTSLSIEGLEKEIRSSMIIENDLTKYPHIINDLFSNHKLLARYSRKGRKFVDKYRNWDTCIVDIISAYNQMDTHMPKTNISQTNDIGKHILETWD